MIFSEKISPITYTRNFRKIRVELTHDPNLQRNAKTGFISLTPNRANIQNLDEHPESGR